MPASDDGIDTPFAPARPNCAAYVCTRAMMANAVRTHAPNAASSFMTSRAAAMSASLMGVTVSAPSLLEAATREGCRWYCPLYVSFSLRNTSFCATASQGRNASVHAVRSLTR